MCIAGVGPPNACWPVIGYGEDSETKAWRARFVVTLVHNVKYRMEFGFATREWAFGLATGTAWGKIRSLRSASITW